MPRKKGVSVGQKGFSWGGGGVDLPSTQKSLEELRGKWSCSRCGKRLTNGQKSVYAGGDGVAGGGGRASVDLGGGRVDNTNGGVQYLRESDPWNRERKTAALKRFLGGGAFRSV